MCSYFNDFAWSINKIAYRLSERKIGLKFTTFLVYFVDVQNIQLELCRIWMLVLHANCLYYSSNNFSLAIRVQQFYWHISWASRADHVATYDPFLLSKQTISLVRLNHRSTIYFYDHVFVARKSQVLNVTNSRRWNLISETFRSNST